MGTGASLESVACNGTCALGKAGTLSGQTSEALGCAACSLGKFGSGNQGDSSVACSICPAGQAAKAGAAVAAVSQSVACSDCEAGTYRAATDNVMSCVAGSSGKGATKETGQSEEAKACADNPAADDTLSSGYTIILSHSIMMMSWICAMLQ